MFQPCLAHPPPHCQRLYLHCGYSTHLLGRTAQLPLLSGKPSQAPPLCSGISHTTHSGKVVQKAMADEFVDLRELLYDKVSLLEKLEGGPPCTFRGQYTLAPGGVLTPDMVHVCAEADCSSGSQAGPSETDACLYMCLVIQEAQKHGDGWNAYDCSSGSQAGPSETDACLYMCLVIQEAQKHGDGWNAYDRKHVAVNLGLTWATLDGLIHAATLLASRTGLGIHCHLCTDLDHLAHKCALAPLLNPGQPARFIPPSQPLSYCCTQSQFPSSSSPAHPICNSWNWGKCAYTPVCSYMTSADNIFWHPPLSC